MSTQPSRSSRFPQALRASRRAKGWTQRELAQRIGVSQSTISFWESGVEAPTIEHLIMLALELPVLLESFDGRERELLRRVLQLERSLLSGRCAADEGAEDVSEAEAGSVEPPGQPTQE